MKLPFNLPQLPRQAWFAVVGVVLRIALGWVLFNSGPLAPTRVTIAKVAKGNVAPLDSHTKCNFR